MRQRFAAALLASTLMASPALAQSASDKDERIAELEARLSAQESRIRQLEERLLIVVEAQPRTKAPGDAAAPVPAFAQAAPTPPPAPEPSSASPLTLAGDLRLRFEHNGSDADARDDSRGVLRARVRASYAVDDWIKLGAQLVTGSQDDPNTTDVTLGNFDDDLEVSLDQAFVHIDRGGLDVWGGKIPQVFRRTDLVWDGDVSPQGVAARYRIPFSDTVSIGATGLYFPIDRSVTGPDSSMAGGQIELAASGELWSAALAAAYYDYRIGSIETADAGDFRGNLLGPDGRYLSDFDLVDIIADVSFRPWGDRWPIAVTADYVKNLGSATSADSGYGIALAAGRSSVPGDWRFGYAYSRAEADAVFAAFSHDNIALATNYRLHALTADYALRSDMILNTTLYFYRPDDPLHAGANDADDWLTRLRLNALFTF